MELCMCKKAVFFFPVNILMVNAYYRQCYRSLVSMQSINLSGQVWISQDILSWRSRILIRSTERASVC